MIPRILCTQCSAEVTPGDKFCANCGSRIDWESDVKAIEESASAEGRFRPCSLCGHQNLANSSYCESCGAAIGKRTEYVRSAAPLPRTLAEKPTSRGARTVQKPSLQFLQSWKLTLALGAIFVAVIVIVGPSKNTSDHVHENLSGGSSGQAAVMTEIDRLQKVVESNPGDMESTLRLANLLHDVKFLPRAITVYQRYLGSNHSNPDARVDLGICYFELALADSGKKKEYLEKAEGEMKKALEFDSRHQLAHFNLGIVNLHSGDIEESNMWFKKCIEINPGSDTGKRARELFDQHRPRALRD